MLAAQQVLLTLKEVVEVQAVSLAGRFWSDRYHPVDAYPAGRVYIVEDDHEADVDGDDITWPRRQQHRLQVEIKLDVQAPARLDEATAELVAEVITALEGSQASATLEPLTGCRLRVTGWRPVPSGDGQGATAQAVIGVEVVFATFSNDPTTLI